MHQGWILDSLNLGGSLQSLLLLERAHLGLSAHDATTPLSPGLVVLVHEAILDGGNQLGQLVLVLGTNLGDGQDSGSLIFSQHSARKLLKRTMTDLLVDNSAQTSLALDDGIGDAHLLAQRRQEDDQLNGVDVVGDQDQRGLLVLNEADDVVQAVLDSVGLLADVLLLLALLDSGSLLQETLLLLGLGLGAVLVEELEGLGGGVAVEDVLELGQGGGTFRRIWRIFFWRWRRTYSGHLTMRERLRLGWMSWPMPKFRGRFSMRGFCGRPVSSGTGNTPEKADAQTLGAFFEPAFP
ncbi:hypothetical protein ACCO45_009126 [Purpureocillium lilacinum]|uniref:Uncharacterized protein n=1 Tax=Purpureocillium lilacinum TaxID=33203 RepID=A0ACC4DIS4_PURLI